VIRIAAAALNLPWDLKAHPKVETSLKIRRMTSSQTLKLGSKVDQKTIRTPRRLQRQSTTSTRRAQAAVEAKEIPDSKRFPKFHSLH